MERQRREFYMIPYPSNERPVIKIGAEVYTLINVSERGVMFEAGEGGKFEEELHIEATVHFRDGGTEEVAGTVLRVYNGNVVVCLSKCIPFARIIREQRLLNRKYKHLFQ